MTTFRPANFRALIRSIGRMPAERATNYKLRQRIFERPDAEEHLPLGTQCPVFAAEAEHAPITSASGY